MPHHFPTFICLNLKPNQGTQEAPSVRRLYLQACTTMSQKEEYSTQYIVQTVHLTQSLL